MMNITKCCLRFFCCCSNKLVYFSYIFKFLTTIFHHSQEAECDKTLMDAKFEADTKVADSERMFKMSAAAYQKQVNTAVSLILL